MAKVKNVFVCQECGTNYAKWQGKCDACQAWNTIEEEVISPVDQSANLSLGNIKKENKPQLLEQVKMTHLQRIDCCDVELNRVLGGGLVKGSLVLLAGEPGIGKSTLLLQIALKLESENVFYISGEESISQVKMRAKRLKTGKLSGWIFSETSTDKIFHYLWEVKPNIIIVDSIQTIQSPLVASAPGTISQIRQTTSELMKYAKETETPVIMVGHITKDGSIAGPKVLEHMVDTVLHFEGERHLTYRILRTVKNRFGSTSELGIYEMLDNGLREVNDPSEILISKKDQPYSGMSICATIEGIRPLLIEIQALVTQSSYGNPQRSTSGFDIRRMNMLIAVLEKRLGLFLGKHDVFLNLAGGVKVIDPALDLAIMVAIISSFNEMIVSQEYCFAAEVGLAGELRPVNRMENRILESQKLGFKKIYVSKQAMDHLKVDKFDIEIGAFPTLREVLKDVYS